MATGQQEGIFEACTPRDDVLSGQLAEDQFAAKLADVVHDPESAPEVYSDPDKFFEKTFPTSGLQKLVGQLATRFTSHYRGGFSGANGVVRLDTAFGGGKTHNQIAAYHLAENPEWVSDLERFSDDEESIRAYTESVNSGLNVNTAVFVGGVADAHDARHAPPDKRGDGPATKTMWGELAYQLFGQEGYDEIREYDENRNAPGEHTWATLFEDKTNPSLILLDEIATYFEQAEGVDVGGSTLGKQTNTFLMSLLSATQNTDSVTVVLSVADTAFEDKADIVRELVKEFNSISDRTETKITPTGDSEIAPVLRHRLFKDVNGELASEAAEEHSRYYESHAEEFPEYVSDAEFHAQLEACYPFHPTVIDTLTEEIDSLPSFQRTRGALKLLSRGVYRLWESRDDQPTERHYLRLYDLHPEDSAVHSTLLTLFQSVEVDFEAAIRHDIHSDRGRSNAEVEDARWVANDLPPLGTQLTTTILWKSIVRGAGGRGVDRRTLRLSVANVDVDLGKYDNALDNLLGGDLESACFFLYDEQKVSFKTEANINKLIDTETDRTEPGVARDRLDKMLRGITGDGAMDVVVGPEEPSDVPDTAETVRLCVMNYDSVVVNADSGDGLPTPSLIETLFKNTAKSSGGRASPRVYKNNVVFLAPDASLVPKAKRSSARVAAIERIQRGLGDQYDLNPGQVDELSERLETATADLSRAIKRAYRHLYYAGDGDDGGVSLDRLTISAVEANDSGYLLDVVLTALDDADEVLLEDDEALGSHWIEKNIWTSDSTFMTTKDIEEQFSKRPSVPILLSPVPIRRTVAELVTEKHYAYWDDSSETGNYTKGDDSGNLDESVDDTKNLSIGLNSGDVRISDDVYVYVSLSALVQDYKEKLEIGGEIVDPPEMCPDCGRKLNECECSSPPLEVDESIKATTQSPSQVERALNDARAEIDKAVQRIKDKHNMRRDDLSTDVQSISIQTEGEDAWRTTWFLTRLIVDGSDYGDETTVSFNYNAVSDDEQNDVVNFGFTGRAETFVSKFKFNREPTGIVRESGERDGEGTITIQVSDSGSDDTEYESVFDALVTSLSTDDDLSIKVSADVDVTDVVETEVAA